MEHNEKGEREGEAAPFKIILLLLGIQIVSFSNFAFDSTSNPELCAGSLIQYRVFNTVYVWPHYKSVSLW